MTEDIDSIIGAVISLVLILFVANAMGEVMQSIGDHDHPELQSTINSHESTIEQLRSENNRLRQENNNLSQEYQELKNESITKEDVKRIYEEINRTDAEVRVLNNRFETVNNQFIDSYQKTVNKYQFWFGFSLVSFTALAFDIVSGAFWGVSFTSRLSEYLKAFRERIRRRKEKDEEE
jgi:gas vesicle protein